MKRLLYILILCSLKSVAQTTTENYVKETIYKVETSNSIINPSQGDALQTINYLDGFGRPFQNIITKASASNKNIVYPIEYNALGKNEKRFLPYISAQTGLNIETTIDYSVGANSLLYGNEQPYGENKFENIPGGRILRQGFPGNDWDVNTGHPIKMEYLFNTTQDSVKIFKVSTTWQSSTQSYLTALLDSGTYSINTLYKNVIKDENWGSGSNITGGVTEEYYDNVGRLVLKRVINNGTKLNTYYVYDKFGNLSYVIPPSVNVFSSITTTILDKLCYQYRYDKLNRLVEKKLPEKDWQFILYDKNNRIVATGPVYSPFLDQQLNQTTTPTQGWSVFKYDALNRNVYTGWQSETSAFTSTLRATRQNTILALTTINEALLTNNPIDGVTVGYTNSVTLFATAFKLLSIVYYDDYNFPNAPVIPSSVENQTVYYNTTNKPKGLITGFWNRIVETSTATIQSEKGYILYDYKDRPIRHYKSNYTGGFTQQDYKYDFTKTLYTIQSHKRTASDNVILIREDFTYDLNGRLLTHIHQINNDITPELISKNEYDEIGRLSRKSVGGEDIVNFTGLQKVDFRYNIRNWLTQINNVDDLDVVNEPTDLFAFKINFNNVDYSQNGNVDPLYNGNIAETIWRTSTDNIKRKYSYEYDALNRLKNAVYEKPQMAHPGNSYKENLTYDKTGNITSLMRSGDLDDDLNEVVIDNLTYFYAANSNRLMKVTDLTNNTSGFKDDSNGTNDTADDFSYDKFGNLYSDQNKGVVQIKYNHLNLPTEILFTTSNKKINYTYTSTGEKIKKTVTNGTRVVSTHYVDGFQYHESFLEVSLLFFPHAEGFVSNTVVNNTNTYNYVYSYKDHLGNVRVNYTYDAINNELKILDENHYYPFGLKHNNYNIDQEYFDENGGIIGILPGASPYKYRFNTKEYQDELGINMYDYGARNYDPAIGRWMNIDPLAETSRRISPYVYALNNPIYFIDPDGMDEDSYQGWGLDDEDNWIWRSDLNKNNYKQLHFKDYRDDYSVVAGCRYKDETGDAYLMSGGVWRWYNEQTKESIDAEMRAMIERENQIIESGPNDEYSDNSTDYNQIDIDKWNSAANGIGIGTGIKSEIWTYAVAQNYKSARSTWDFVNLRPSQQTWRINNTLGKFGTKAFNLTKGLGTVAGAIQVGVKGYEIYNKGVENATVRDWTDLTVNTAGLVATIFFASNPIGWAVGGAALIYSIGTTIYDSNQSEAIKP